jgi:hypothetical protein
VTDRSRTAAVVAAAVGAAWGLLGYALLWGHTPFVVHRPFVVSAPGTLLLLPVRIVLWGIHVVERSVGHPFDFSQRNAWIGALAGLVGVAIAVVGTIAVGAVVRRARSGS